MNSNDLLHCIGQFCKTTVMCSL